MEQYNDLSASLLRNLPAHCQECGSEVCSPVFEQTTVLTKCRTKLTREIVEAVAKIAKLKGECVSTLSVSISNKEIAFLSGFI